MRRKSRLQKNRGEPYQKKSLVSQDNQEIKPKKMAKSWDTFSAYNTYLYSEMEAERKRIARELHDFLGHELLCINMDLLLLEEKVPKNISSVHKKIRPMSRRLDKILKNIQKMIAELRPELLDKLGLQAAMEWQASEFEKRAKIPCHINFDVIVELGNEQEMSIFRIFQEALANIMRHSKATRVAVNLKTNKNQLIITVDDDGKGITEKQVNDPQSYGIIGMKERASSCGGYLKIRGIKNKGTSVHLYLPFNIKTKKFVVQMNH